MITHETYTIRKSNGKIWPTAKTIFSCIGTWNYATRPYVAMSEKEHKQANKIAKAVKNRMARLGFKCGIHYSERSNGELFPLPLGDVQTVCQETAYGTTERLSFQIKVF